MNNEEPDPDDENEIVAILPPNKEFLLSFFIEYLSSKINPMNYSLI